MLFTCMTKRPYRSNHVKNISSEINAITSYDFPLSRGIELLIDRLEIYCDERESVRSDIIFTRKRDFVNCRS